MVKFKMTLYQSEDIKAHNYNYTIGYYDNFVKILALFKDDIRKQAEFMNIATEDWSLRLCYPDLPILMYNYFKLLEYRKFNECSESNQKKIMDFFVCQRCCEYYEEMSADDILQTKEYHKKLGLLPWL